MVSLELVFLPAIFLLGIITSYQDLKYGKIKNKWILFALVYSFIVYFIEIFFYLNYGKLNPEYLIMFGANILFAILIGFGLWYIKIWTAGDGKLFITYSILIPLSAYSLVYQKWIACLSLLTNIFVLAFIVLFFHMLFKIKFEDIKKVSLDSFKESIKFKKIIFSIINLFAILWIVGILLSLVNLDNSILKIVLTIIILLSIPKKYENKLMYFLFSFVILRLIIDKSIYSWSFLINFVMIIFIWVGIKSFLEDSINKFGRGIFSKEIGVDKIKPGMILSDAIIKKNKNELEFLKKDKDMKIIKYKGDYYIQKPKSLFDFNNFINEEPEGLTKEQIILIKKAGIKKIKISQVIPFAIFIFAGTLLTLIVKGNFLSFLKGIF